MVRFTHIVWAPATGPIAQYANPELAHAHARTMVGVDVVTLPISTELPSVVRDDLERDFDEDDDTPEISVVHLEDLDDP